MSIKNYAEKNREAWNEAAGVHGKSRKIDYKEKFKDRNFSVLDGTLSSLLKKIPLEGGVVAQLCCNDGRELLSIINIMGAAGVGFDISDELLLRQKKLLNRLNLTVVLSEPILII